MVLASACLYQQLSILSRQVTRLTLTQRDRMLLVLLAIYLYN
jgi:hypothetical protein